ncbi:MAG: hypothetical protein JW715_13290 [Sedimentisphaerales bacterium]|nr:hypothetical protein [Sedimentisphaerales bacterium]
MKKTTVLLVLAFMVVGVFNPIVKAMPLMGPPRATLMEGQSSFGLEFTHSEMNLEAFGPVIETQASPYSKTTSYTKYKIKDLQTNMVMGRIGAGMWDGWDVFLRFGMTGGKDEISEIQADGSLGRQFSDFDGSLGFSWGFGTRATFYQEGDTSWGGLIQLTWSNPDESSIIDDSDSSFTGDAEINIWEVQVAVGPTVELENCRFYGGPFLHFVNGDFDLSGITTVYNPNDLTVEASHDIREESQFGGYAGAQWYLGENSSLCTEIQFTEDVWGVGLSTIWKF